MPAALPRLNFCKVSGWDCAVPTNFDAIAVGRRGRAAFARRNRVAGGECPFRNFSSTASSVHRFVRSFSAAVLALRILTFKASRSVVLKKDVNEPS